MLFQLLQLIFQSVGGDVKGVDNVAFREVIHWPYVYYYSLFPVYQFCRPQWLNGVFSAGGEQVLCQ